MFGKSYLNAAKDAWNLLKQRGIDALVNDCLVVSKGCGSSKKSMAETFLEQHLDIPLSGGRCPLHPVRVRGDTV